MLPDNVDTVRLALELDSIASRYGVAIRDVRVGDEAGQNADGPILPENSLPYQKVIVSFQFTSNYENAKRFLSDMEKNLRIMEIKSLSFKSDDSGLYTYNVAIETYWLKE